MQIMDSGVPGVGLAVWGDPVDDGALQQIRVCAQGAKHTALMADHHRGYSMPIGGVVGYLNAVSPSGVGYDIGCGNKAVRLNLLYGDLKSEMDMIMDMIFSSLSFGVGRTNAEEVDMGCLETHPAWTLPACAPLKELARNQLGTVGGGNHFVDIFEDENGYAWVGVHFGSRGLGHKTATWFLEQSGAKDGMDVPPTVLSLNSQLGLDYLVAMELCGSYAYAGRNWVCSKVAKLLGGTIVEEVHNHHNYAWRESHQDRDGHWHDLLVVRKGATPAFIGQKGFIGGSMCDISVIIEGVESPDCREALFSTVHGAGRVMGRMDAKGKWKGGVCVREPKVTQAMMDAWVAEAGVVLRGGGVDESPHVYKRLPDVLKAHGDTIKVLHTLTPRGVAMAPRNVVDPYKD